MPHIAQIILPAFLLDCLLGDPQNPLHPVRIIGRMISWGVGFFRKFQTKNHVVEFVFGMMLTIILLAFVYGSAVGVVGFLRVIEPWAAYIFEILLCYFIIAPRALRDESMKVYDSLQAEDITGARENLSRIVGRDTAELDSPAIVRATVETVAENFSDGVIAPLFFICIGGVPLGLAYKTINTLDSMIGYRNEKYEYFGKFAARLDDVANWIPSRISALFLLLATFVTKTDSRRALRVYLRDRRKHKSPNSAQTETVCAGALGLQLGGDNFYAGKLVSKPTLGDSVVSPAPLHIVTANRLMYAATAIGISAMLAATLGIQAGWRFFYAI